MEKHEVRTPDTGVLVGKCYMNADHDIVLETKNGSREGSILLKDLNLLALTECYGDVAKAAQA